MRRVSDLRWCGEREVHSAHDECDGYALAAPAVTETTDAREARNALLRTLQEEGVAGRRRQRIEDAADWFATVSVRAALRGGR